jgi:hypothetical protein
MRNSIFYTWPQSRVDLEFHYRKTRKAFERVLDNVAAQHHCRITNHSAGHLGMVWAPTPDRVGLKGDERGWARIVLVFCEPSDRILVHEAGHMARHLVDDLTRDREGVPRHKPPRSHSRGYKKLVWREEIILNTQWSLFQYLSGWRDKDFVFTKELPPIKVYDQMRHEYVLH